MRLKIARYRFAHTTLRGRFAGCRKGHFHSSDPRPKAVTTAAERNASARLTSGPTRARRNSLFHGRAGGCSFSMRDSSERQQDNGFRNQAETAGGKHVSAFVGTHTGQNDGGERQVVRPVGRA